MEQDISFINNIGVVLRGNPFFCLVEGLATALPAVAPLDAFPFCLPQGKSPALCQREGTEGKECKYFSPAKLKPTFAKIGGGIDLAMLVTTSHRKLFP